MYDDTTLNSPVPVPPPPTAPAAIHSPPQSTTSKRHHQRRCSSNVPLKTIPLKLTPIPTTSHPLATPTKTTTNTSLLSPPPSPPGKKCCWATLLTRASYLPGVILLSHSFRKNSSRYPLIVLTTSTLPETCIKVLDACHIPHHHVEPIDPPHKVNIAAERFADTWTKLRVFELTEYDVVALIDGDMLIRRNMDEIMTERVGESELPHPRDGGCNVPGIAEDVFEPGCYIQANHACVCNPTNADWAPPDWYPENCAYTIIKHPSALNHPTPVPPTPLPKNCLRTHTLLNSGLVIFSPSKKLFAAMMKYLSTTPLLTKFIFPDQDFLAAFFVNRWRPIGWQYNAIKTLRYEHSQVWRDEEVRNCHYIVDKPWKVGRTKRINGGRDSLTHGWWWEDWKEWSEGLHGRTMLEGENATAAEVVRREMGEEDT